jgi:hypothetical protein
MTLFLGDFSHYDDTFTLSIAQRIKADGIVGLSHKVSEGLGGLDDEADECFTYSRQAGFEFIGGYGVVRTGDGAAQARVMIARCDVIAPWWRSFPGWFWQVDLERWDYDNVSAQDGREYADELAKTGKRVVVYASKGQYGDSLRGWPYPLWNANYPSSRQAPYRSLYPGDSGPGWVTYSGQMPAFWQYASSATIGGLTTCDVSAYRGTLDQLRALITGRVSTSSISTGGDDVSLSDPIPGTGTPDAHKQDRSGKEVLHDVWWALGAAGYSDWQAEQLLNTRRILAGQAASQKREEATLAALTALASGGTSVDTAAVLARINEVAEQESAAVTALHQELADLRSARAAAAQAEATALAE